MTVSSQSAAFSPSDMADVAIVGGGLVGRLLAWRLARAGIGVSIFERGDAQGTSAAAWVAAAMLAPLAESVVAEPLLAELGAASLERWSDWLAELPMPVFFQRNGTLVVWHAADQVEASLFQRRLVANAPARLRDGAIRVLDGPSLAQAEPALAGRFKQGWLLAGEGQLDNRQLLAAVGAALDQAGVPIHTGTAIDANNWPSARLTIDCRGLGAKPALPALRGIRGEVARVDAPGIGLMRPVRLLHPRYPIYIAPKENDRYVIGATEIESEDMSPVSVRSALELLSAAFSVHPGFGEARIVELNSQCRPTLPDHRPAIMLEDCGAPVVSINGLYRHGFMIAPEVVSQAEALVLSLLDGGVRTDDQFDDWRATARWPELLSRVSAVPVPAASAPDSAPKPMRLS